MIKEHEFSSIWHNSVVRGDVNRIEIGRYTNVQDNSVVHVADENPTLVADFVSVGHSAVLHGCMIEEHCLIGIGAKVLNGAHIGKGSIVAAGSVVRENHVIPPYSLVAGVPAKVIKEIPDEFHKIHALAVKYKTLWTERYGLCPNGGGEVYRGEKII